MTAGIKPIETHYKGHRFRSRLEARWAVFFDTLGVEWVYEPQGYVVGDGRPYLPDFWVPSLSVWVEVKGVLTHHDLQAIAAAAGSTGLPMSLDDDRQPSRDALSTWGARLLLLGNIPEPKRAPHHALLAFVAGETVIYRSFIGRLSGQWRPVPIGHPVPADQLAKRPAESSEESRINMLSTEPLARVDEDGRVTNAYRAARSARFEHGESGVPTPRPPVMPVDPYLKIRPLMEKLQCDFSGVVNHVIDRFDLTQNDARDAAMRATTPLVARLEDVALRESWTPELARRLGIDVWVVHACVAEYCRRFRPGQPV